MHADGAQHGIMGGNCCQRLDFTACESIIVYNGTITAAGKTWRQALLLLTCTSDKKVQADIVTISTTVSSCGASHHWLQGLVLFRDLRKLAVQADIVAGNAVLNTLDQSKRWQQCWHSFAQLRATFLQPGVISLNSLISASSTEGHWQNTFCCFTQAPSFTLQQDAFSHSSLVRACELDELRELFFKLGAGTLQCRCQQLKNPAGGRLQHDYSKSLGTRGKGQIL